MTNAVVTPAINLSGLGIQELQQAVNHGQATVKEVFDIVDGRIKKRIAEKRTLLKPVVEYRNKLAEQLAHVGVVAAPIQVPVYINAKPNAALPTDPEQLADVVFATVGAANIGAVISRLTARVIGA